ncbi:hypothetical protein D3C80_1427580 [compost metagenome]
MDTKPLRPNFLLDEHEVAILVVRVPHRHIIRPLAFIFFLERDLEYHAIGCSFRRRLEIAVLKNVVDEVAGLHARGNVESRQFVNQRFDDFQAHFNIALSSFMMTSTCSIDLVSELLSRSATLPNFLASLVLIKLTSIPSFGVVAFIIGKCGENIR